MQNVLGAATNGDGLSVDLLLERGDAEAQRGNREGALACFKYVLRLDNTNETALWQSAMLTHDVYEARTVLQRLLQINPDHALARSFLELAEKQCEEAAQAQATLPPSWEKYADTRSSSPMPHLGEYLIQRGFLTPLQVQAALDFQEAERHLGNRDIRLGEILLSFDYINRWQLDEALTALQATFNDQLS